MSNDKTKDDLQLPASLDRKKNGVTTSTPEERAEFAARSGSPADQAQPVDEGTAAVEAEIEQKKKVKTHNRIARLKDKKALDTIPEKFRAWDARNARWYDKRNPKVTMKENAMTAVQTVTTKNGKRAAPPKKATAPKKATGHKVAGKQKRDTSTIENLVKLAQRPKGVDRKEMVEATGLQNAGFNTILKNAGDARGLKLKIDKSGGRGKYRYTLVK